MGDPKADLLQGTLEMLILRALAGGSKHGYGIVKWLEETSGQLLQVEQGSLYPALYRMEDREWISAEWGVTDLNRRAKFYALTAKGRERLEAEVAGWERLVTAVTLVLAPPDPLSCQDR